MSEGLHVTAKLKPERPVPFGATDFLKARSVSEGELIPELRTEPKGVVRVAMNDYDLERQHGPYYLVWERMPDPPEVRDTFVEGSVQNLLCVKLHIWRFLKGDQLADEADEWVPE